MSVRLWSDVPRYADVEAEILLNGALVVGHGREKDQKPGEGIRVDDPVYGMIKHRIHAFESFPTHETIVKMLHLSSCDFAIANWDQSWGFCPVCGAEVDLSDTIVHRDVKGKDAN